MMKPTSPPQLHPVVAQVTQRVIERSRSTRATYMQTTAASKRPQRYRAGMGCANVAHAFAAMPAVDKLVLHQERQPNVGIITAYNDMLSAHQPYEGYPTQLRAWAREMGATAQVAGGVPAMCDGVTQGYEGMELSLFSRDVIALGTAVGLTHNVYDGALLLGICDKIVPGLLIGALQFGHLPMLFVPAGPMSSGLSNDEKAKVRQQHAQGLVDRTTLLAAEEAAYHGPGTCTFYGTANSNQMLLEIMGLQLPGSSFVHPGTELRQALSRHAMQRVLELARSESPQTLADIVSEKTVVNGIIGLLATGGSTNHTIHLVAMARAAGIFINWDDFDELSAVIPLLTRIYPNGKADVNHFHAAGGMGFLINQLLGAGMLHEDVQTVMGSGLHRCTLEPWLDSGQLAWRKAASQSADEQVLRPVQRPFTPDGGLKLLKGNLGRSVVKYSAVAPEHRRVRAPALVLDSQQALLDLFKTKQLERDFVAVLRFQGPQANGMPELHKLTPVLGSLLDRGFKVALVTDGRMSGASGKVPAAIHLSPEALLDGPIAKVRDGDMVLFDCEAGLLQVEVEATEWSARSAQRADLSSNENGFGRELFAFFRRQAGLPECGGSALFGNH